MDNTETTYHGNEKTYESYSIPSGYTFYPPWFRKEVKAVAKLSMNKELIKESIHSILWSIKDYEQDYLFINEYGYIGNIDSRKRLLKYNMNELIEGNCEIYLHPAAKNYMYFKVLPKETTKENYRFLRNPKKFDGFVCYENYLSNDFPEIRDMTLMKFPAPVATCFDGFSIYH